MTLRRFVCFCILSTLLLFSLLLGSGCRPRQPPPFSAPPAQFEADHFIGSPLSGPTPADVPTVAPQDALAVRVTFIALENPPQRIFDPLDSKARFISATRGGSPILPSARLTEKIQLLTLSNPSDLAAKLQAAGSGQLAPTAPMTGALPHGVTAEFDALDPTPIDDTSAGQPTLRHVKIQVARASAADHLVVALVLEDFSPAEPATLQSERALLDLPSPDNDNVVFIVPFRFGNAQSQALAVLVEISPGTNDDAHKEALARCLADLRRSTADAAARPGISSGQASGWSSVQAGIASLSTPAGRRSAFVFLANQSDADLCEDVALVADANVLAQLAAKVQAKIAVNNSPQSDAAVGWILDHETLELLANLLSADTGTTGGTPMPDELAAVLTTYAGEVGRHSSSMDEILRGLASREDLENRLLAENLIFLEDSSPASRVRAFDWLQARGHAPAGYDPLAPPKERRLALERGLAAAATSEPSGGK